MNTNFNRHSCQHASGLRGFVAFVAAALWFLLTILVSAPADARQASGDASLETQYFHELVRQALIDRGAAPTIKIEFDSQDASVDQTDLSSMTYNGSSGRFFIRRSDNSLISGTAFDVIQAPVLARPISRGEIITESDIELVEVASTRSDIIMAIEDAIGMEARRALPKSMPLREHDLKQPLLVQKGALITLNYVMAGLRLTHQGVALNNGGAGDVISVKNPQSDVTIRAIVEGKNRARAFATAHAVVEG